MSTVDVQAWAQRLVDMHTPNVLTHVYLRSTVDFQAWDGSMFILGAFARLELGGTAAPRGWQEEANAATSSK